jgi:hypothetical protein
MQEMTDARISLPEHYIEIGDYRDESGFRTASTLVGLKEPLSRCPKLGDWRTRSGLLRLIGRLSS